MQEFKFFCWIYYINPSLSLPVWLSGEVGGLLRVGQYCGGESSGVSALRPAGDLLLQEAVPAAALAQRDHQ